MTLGERAPVDAYVAQDALYYSYQKSEDQVVEKEEKHHYEEGPKVSH
jgi:hypothetical protein